MAAELILIVEDNDKNLKLLRDVLQFKGYQTVEATTAEKGLEIARAQQPDLVLMDVQLPGMDGITAFRLLRADPLTKRVPVIAVTASAMKFEQEGIVEAGFEGYLAKPIRVKEFTEEVRRVLNSRVDTKAGS